MKIITEAKFVKQGNAAPATIEINGVRFFSVPPKDKTDEERINTVLSPATADEIWRRRFLQSGCVSGA